MPSYDVSYTYDGVGNRLMMVDNLSGDRTTYAYDAANQLTIEEDASGVTTYSYDADGNRTRKEAPAAITDFTWDEESRLTLVELPTSDGGARALNATWFFFQGAEISAHVWQAANAPNAPDTTRMVVSLGVGMLMLLGLNRQRAEILADASRKRALTSGIPGYQVPHVRNAQVIPPQRAVDDAGDVIQSSFKRNPTDGGVTACRIGSPCDDWIRLLQDEIAELNRTLSSHVRRYHRHYGTSGHVWQGRFKAFPIQSDEHLLIVMRYVERNPVRASALAIRKAERWFWSSIGSPPNDVERPPLHAGPVPRPEDWIAWVNTPLTEAELAAVRKSVLRGAPFGDTKWQSRTARRLGLESTLRPRGRPRKSTEK